MALIALVILVTSGRPIFYRGTRVGRGGQFYTMLKFRTLRPGAEQRLGAHLGEDLVFKTKQERTTIGRWLRATQLDELPQLLNVLRGEMSLVGPRPERPEFVELFDEQVRRYQDRHRVKSGITGLAQVHGLRGQTSLTDRIELDNYYIQNWSLGLDLRILAKTLVAAFRSPGE
jgi:lipopolysaccharide/colanic/teichoic acid biosynthesis glycosyltransferase